MPFVCRRCTSLPKFRTYNNLRIHLRTIHDTRPLPNSELWMFEVYPGSRYLLPEFQSNHSSHRSNEQGSHNEVMSVQNSQTQASASAHSTKVGSTTEEMIEKKVVAHFSCGLKALDRSMRDRHNEMVTDMQQAIATGIENGMRNVLQQFFDQMQNQTLANAPAPANVPENPALEINIDAEDLAEKPVENSPTNSDRELMNVSLTETEKEISVSEFMDEMDQEVS